MKILFYLPVVTPWWFDNVIEPLLRRLAAAAEIHVLAPGPWCGTGIDARELERCVDLPDVRWCLMEGPDHPSTRTKPVAAADIVDFVREIGPDYVFCRSADCETAAAFPGQVRYLMEGGVAPFPLPPGWIMFQDRPFDQGHLPALDAAGKAALEGSIEPAWSALRQRYASDPSRRGAVLGEAGIAADRPILLLPLEYEHEENFFRMHSMGARPNARLVEEMAASVGREFRIAVTDHPLNQLYVDPSALREAVGGLGDRAVLVPSELDGVPATLALAPHVAGMIVGDSKTFSIATFCGTPMLRRSRFGAGSWMAAYSDLDAFLAAITTSTAVGAAEADARLWTAYHLANNVFDPQDDALTADDILDRVDHPVASHRWAAGIARVRAVAPELFAR